MQWVAMRSFCGKRWLLLLSAWLLLLGSVHLPAAGGSSGHVVTRMRGFDGPLPFYLETGYVEVDEEHGVQLFYYFVRSENDPDEDPLLLWLSGGPGCSGFSGLAYEIGPLQFDAQGYRGGGFPDLLYRPETWTKNAQEICGGKYNDIGNVVCAKIIQAIDNITSDINREHILEPVCQDDEQLSPKTMAEKDGMSRLMMLESADFLSGFKCRKASYILSNIWGNDETIQENLGVRKGTIGAWKRCNTENLLYNKNVQSVVSYHSRLAAKGYRALIYSGDHDRIVPFVGTQAWIRYLNLTIVDDWRPWFVGGQVAGFTRNSGNLTYATVKGAGHTAPEYKPMECQTMFRNWISYDPL